MSYLNKHIVGRTLATVKAQHDENVFGKVGTSAVEFEKALTGKKVLNARRQGKYFWYDVVFYCLFRRVILLGAVKKTYVQSSP